MTEVVNGFLFAGGSSPGTVDLVADSVHGSTYAQWTIGYDGYTYDRHTAGAAAQDAAWISPQSGMDQFEVWAELASGDSPPGTLNSWLSLASSRTWGWTAQATPRTCDLTVKIRRASDLVVVDTATITITADGIS